MNQVRPFRYIVLGVGLTMAAALLVGAVRPADPPVGRFQISACNHHAYIIDTATGVVWDHRINEVDGDWGPGDFHGNKLQPQDQHP